jgi:hypothetical protein
MANDANIIKIKRSGTSGAPASLKLGELAYSYLTASGNPTSNGGDRLFIGANGVNNGTGNANDVIVIGGKYFTDLLDHERGVLTASSALIVNADKKLDELLVDNLSLNGNTLSSSTGFLTLSAANNVIQLASGTIIASGSFEGAQLDLNSGGAALQHLRAGVVTLAVGSSGTATSTVTLNNDGTLTVPGTINTLSNGDLILAPHGTGKVQINTGANSFTLPATRTSTTGYVLTANTDGTTSWAAGASSLSLHAGTGGLNTGTDATINLLTDNLELRGVGPIYTELTKTTIGSNDFYVSKINARLATTSDTGVASFSSDFFSVNITGAVSLKDSGVTNSKLEHSSFYIGTTNITLGDASGHTTSLAVDISGKATTAGTADNVAYELSAGDDLDFDAGSTFDGSADRTLNVTSTLDSVTGRGDTTTNSITVGGLTIGSGPGSYTFPTADGTAGYVLTSHNDGTLTWAQPSTSLTLTADSGGPRTVSLVSDTVNFVGGTNITSVASAGATIDVTFNLDSNLTSVDSISSSSNTGDVTLNASGGHSYVFKTDGTVSFNGAYTFPSTVAGGAGYVLTDAAGNGTLSWAEPAASLDFTGDNEGAGTVDLLNNTFVISGGTNITTSASGQTLTIDLDSSLTGVSIDGSAGSVANSLTFATTGGTTANSTFNGSTAVTIDYSTIGAAPEAGSSSIVTVGTLTSGSIGVGFTAIPNSALENDSVTVGTTEISLGSSSTTLAGLTQVDIGDLQIHSDTIIENVGAAADGDITLKPKGDGHVSVSDKFIKDVKDPEQPQDAATKAYVDRVAQGLHTHQAVRLATTAKLATIVGSTAVYDNGPDNDGHLATITLGVALTTLDNVAVVNGDRILVKNEGDVGGIGSYANGIYTINSLKTILTRADDFETISEIAGGDFVFVQTGDTYGDTGWVQTEETTAIGSGHPIVWSQFSGAGAYSAGAGLSIDGTTFNVEVSATGGIEIVSDALQLKSTLAGDGLTYADGVLDADVDNTSIAIDGSQKLSIKTTWAGQTAITTVGTLTSGSIGSGFTTIASAYGGTGFSTYAKGDLIYASAANTLSKLTAGTNGQTLQMQDGLPVWADLDGGTY